MPRKKILQGSVWKKIAIVEIDFDVMKNTIMIIEIVVDHHDLEGTKD